MRAFGAVSLTKALAGTQHVPQQKPQPMHGGGPGPSPGQAQGRGLSLGPGAARPTAGGRCRNKEQGN